MKIIKTRIPEDSSLYANHSEYNYIDSYEGIVNDKNNIVNIVDVGNAFLKPGPKWADSLFALRNKVVALFGLKTPNDIGEIKKTGNYKFEPGERVGLFRVFSRTNNEIILGEDDKHLNFRVSLFLEEPKNNKTKKIITVTTIVIYNNWFGQLYFYPVKPFHKLIVQTGLKKNLQELELEKNS